MLSQNKYMHRLKIAGRGQVSFRPVPILMVVKIIWSTVYDINSFVYVLSSSESMCQPLVKKCG